MFYLEDDISKIIEDTKSIKKYFIGKTILITGGNGFLGKYFTEIFKRFSQNSKKKIKIIILDNFATSSKLNNFQENKEIKFKKFDATKPLKLNNKIDIIIHAAGIASPYYYRKKPLETLDVSIMGTRNLLNLAKKNNSKFLFFSSSEIYGDPDTKNIPTKETYRGNVSSMGPRACYDESKRLGETLCYIYNKKYNININIIRPFNIYGPGMNKKDYRVMPNFVSNIINNKKLKIYGNGKQTRTYCYITDGLNGFIRVLALGKPGEVYNIGNTKPEISVDNLIKVIRNLYSKKILVKKTPYPKSYPEDEPSRRCPNISKAKRHLNFKPKIKLSHGIKKYINWAEIYYKEKKR